MNNLTMNEFQYEHKQINSKNIISEPRYQRQVDFTRVKKIVSRFNPNLVNDIKVSFRDGKYYVFDGQHTLKSLVLKNGGNDLMVNCRVYYGMTVEDEAILFAEQNGISRNVESSDKLHALYTAGHVDVIDFVETAQSLGIVCDFKKKRASYNTLICHHCAYNIFIKYGREHFVELISIIIGAWQREESSFRREIINGLNSFMIAYAGEYNKDALIKRLQTTSPVVIIREGNAYSNGGYTRYARQILNCYNAKTRSGRLKDKF